ncbi:MAG: pentapeptide repeat-containing protein [Cyanobacteria bacterium SBC]|nr:pentapeptide repeat-containing protein [Cyanobacteria bacterium SBC]
MRRVVNLLKRIANKLAEYEEGSEDGWDRKTALVRWAEVCGGAPLDEYRFAFLHREVKRCSDDDDRVSLWQKTLCDLIGYVLLHGMPMERLDPRPSYAEESRQSRNAEEALLIVLNACSCVTQQLSTIDWPTLLDYPGKSNAFGTWLGRLREQRVSDEEIAPLSYLGWLNLGGCSLPFVDLVGADLSGARLRDANLSGARLRDANLSGANLSGARLRRSDLSGARLRRADLSGADLFVADLSVANLSRADLSVANLSRADLRDANLSEANLSRADLSEANLSRADLSEANLSGARLSVANLSRADLSRADLSGANGLLPDRLLQAKSWREAKLPEDLEYLKQEQ